MPKLFSQNPTEEDNTRQAIPLTKSKAELVNGIPLSGEDYLLVVREQASKYAKTTVAAPPKTVKQVQLSSQFQFLLDQQSVSNASSNQPSTVWREGFIEHFREFQKYKQNEEKRVIKDPKGVSTMEEWKDLCQSKPMESVSEVVKSLSQHTILKLLKFYTQWLQAELVENQVKWSKEVQCLWIFHLLIYLDSVMVSKNVSILRGLAKRAIEIRDDRTEPYLNIIVVIIAVVYGQLDLIQ